MSLLNLFPNSLCGALRNSTKCPSRTSDFWLVESAHNYDFVATVDNLYVVFPYFGAVKLMFPPVPARILEEYNKVILFF